MGQSEQEISKKYGGTLEISGCNDWIFTKKYTIDLVNRKVITTDDDGYTGLISELGISKNIEIVNKMNWNDMVSNIVSNIVKDPTSPTVIFAYGDGKWISYGLFSNEPGGYCFSKNIDGYYGSGSVLKSLPKYGGYLTPSDNKLREYKDSKISVSDDGNYIAIGVNYCDESEVFIVHKLDGLTKRKKIREDIIDLRFEDNKVVVINPKGERRIRKRSRLKKPHQIWGWHHKIIE